MTTNNIINNNIQHNIPNGRLLNHGAYMRNSPSNSAPIHHPHQSQFKQSLQHESMQNNIPSNRAMVRNNNVNAKCAMMPKIPPPNSANNNPNGLYVAIPPNTNSALSTQPISTLENLRDNGNNLGDKQQLYKTMQQTMQRQQQDSTQTIEQDVVQYQNQGSPMLGMQAQESQAVGAPRQGSSTQDWQAQGAQLQGQATSGAPMQGSVTESIVQSTSSALSSVPAVTSEKKMTSQLDSEQLGIAAKKKELSHELTKSLITKMRSDREASKDPGLESSAEAEDGLFTESYGEEVFSGMLFEKYAEEVAKGIDLRL